MSRKLRPSVLVRTAVHLATLCQDEPAMFGASNGLTQDGIAAALGKARSHIAIELDRLAKRGLVQQKLSHVLGRSRCVRVYYLTSSGHELAQEARESFPALSGITEQPDALPLDAANGLEVA